MNKQISELEADELKPDETGGVSRETNGGVRPRPIRKRGYHRALKRGEPWAKIEKFNELLLKHANEMIELNYRIDSCRLECEPMGLKTLFPLEITGK